MRLAIVARAAVCPSIIEYLNTYGSQITYAHTDTDYFDTREIAVFLVDGSEEDIPVMKNFIHHTYDSSSVIALLYLSQKNVGGYIGDGNT